MRDKSHSEMATMPLGVRVGCLSQEYRKYEPTQKAVLRPRNSESAIVVFVSAVFFFYNFLFFDHATNTVETRAGMRMTLCAYNYCFQTSLAPLTFWVSGCNFISKFVVNLLGGAFASTIAPLRNDSMNRTQLLQHGHNLPSTCT